MEGLPHVRSEDEDVEGEAEAVPDQPEDEEDPGLGPDAMDEEAAGGDAHDGQGHPKAPGNSDHNRLHAFLVLLVVDHHQPEPGHQCVDEEKEADDVEAKADASDDEGACVEVESKEGLHRWESHVVSTSETGAADILFVHCVEFPPLLVLFCQQF